MADKEKLIARIQNHILLTDEIKEFLLKMYFYATVFPRGNST